MSQSWERILKYLLFFKINFKSLYYAILGVWWDYCGDPLPIFKKYAIRISSEPCRFSPCGQKWSAFEAVPLQEKLLFRISIFCF